MKLADVAKTDVAKTAFAMPLTDPAYPRGPYKFYNREFVIISYRTDPDLLREVVPEPLEVVGDTVNYEFIRMPDSTGFGDYTLPYARRDGPGRRLCACHVSRRQFADAGGREIWGFPKKLATPKISHESETLVCTLHYGSVLCVSATMGYKHREIDPAPLIKSLAKPSFMILRAGALLSSGRHIKARGPAPLQSSFSSMLCAMLPACRCAACVRHPFRHRPDAWPWRGGARLFEGRLIPAWP